MVKINVRSVQFSHSVLSDSLQPHGLQHASRCASQLPELAQAHVHRVGDAIQPSHPLSSPTPPAFNLSQHQGFFSNESVLHSGGQSIGVSASASFPPVNIQNWFPLQLTGLISLQSKGFSRVFSNTIVQKHQLSGAWLIFIVQLSHAWG